MKGHRCTVVPAGVRCRIAARGGAASSPARSRPPRRRLSLRPGRRRSGRDAPDFDAGTRSRLGRRLGRGASVGRARRRRAAAAVAGYSRRPGRRRSPAARLAWPNRRFGAWRGSLPPSIPHWPARASIWIPRIASDAADQLVEELCWGRARIRSFTAAASAASRGCGDLRHGEPAPWRLPTASPIGWKSPPAANSTTWPCGRPCAERPGPGQVEIRVRATGLNFRDVLNVLDLYPGDPGPLGGECAGEIAAVGRGRRASQAGRPRSWPWPRPALPATR